MPSGAESRRKFLKTAGLGLPAVPMLVSSLATSSEYTGPFDTDFLIDRSELTLLYENSDMQRKLSFRNFSGAPGEWRKACHEKLAGLIGFSQPVPGEVTELRRLEYQGLGIHALLMKVSQNLSIPAYLLVPGSESKPQRGFMAIHGHGQVEPLIGLRDDPHHCFGLEMARAGYLVLCPELRGFGTLRNMTFGTNDRWLDYWDSSRGRQFTLVTDNFLYGKTLIGQHVEDLLRWEKWFCDSWNIKEIDVAGLSYGGDLALIYPVFSNRVRKIFASGTLGSFSPIFSRCYNAPAHCIPGILNWMDRSDIAGLNAPRPLTFHYGALDLPGPSNSSASYNESVGQSVEEVREIYLAFLAENNVSLSVTQGRGHEMDLEALRSFFRD